MEINSLGFIGGGRITYLLLKALQKKNALPEKVVVADPNTQVRTKVASIDPAVIEAVTDNKIAAQADIVFLSVHPPVVKEVVESTKENLRKDAIFISLAPVVSIEKLSVMLGGFKRTVRIIPNAPSIIHQGYNPVVFGAGIKEEEKSALMGLFKQWGKALEVEENKLEAYAIVTAMGPTYFWFQWLKLKELGEEFGMSDAELKLAMPAMLHGATELLFQSDLSSEQVMDLIPVCPLKDDEPPINNIFEKKLTGLYAKLTQK